jgi:hypothetical protein
MATRPEDLDRQAGRIAEMPEAEDRGFSGDVDGVQIERRGNSATVDFNPGMSRMSQDDSEDHAGNIMFDLSMRDQQELSNKVIEWVETDIDSRKDWELRMDQAMELLGLNNIPLEELPFDGASAVTYPLIGEAVVQFQARAIEEVFPSEGPVKTKVVGKMTREIEDQADRIKNHMNYQILDQDRSYFWQVDSMLFYLPLGGSAFKKTYWDSLSNMVVSRYISSTDFIVPYIATDLASAPRYTHRMFKNKTEMKKLFESGFWEPIELPDLTPYATDTGDDRVREYEDIADSRTADVHTDDNVYTVLECHCDLAIDTDQERYGRTAPLPYIVTVERETRSILSIRRNWKEDDQLMQKRIWFTHYKYLPGLGFYGFGLLHMIGSVAEATSGTIRALLDAASFANMQGGYVSSDAKMKPGDAHITPGLYKEVNMTAEELNKAFYTPPFREPSQALAKLFEVLLDAGKSFSSSTEVLTGEASNTGPVGTTIALIEQGSKPLSAIHRRLHMAAAEEFKLRAELNYEFLPDRYPYKVEDEESVVLRNDYDGRVDVIPISDPNIFSSMQRIAQGQALIERSEAAPDLYNRMEVEERFLKAIRIPDPEGVLSKEEAPVREDPVQENMKMLQGQGGKAFMDQDHDAHIRVHINFINGLMPEALEEMGPIMQAHMAEHYAMKYFNEMNRQLGGQLPPPGSFSPEQPLPPEQELMISQAAAQIPQIQIMEESANEEDEIYEREQARLDDAHSRDMSRQDERTLADIERQEMAAMSAEQRNDYMAQRKEAREQRANEAKIERENKLAAAKAATQKKARPSGTSKT